MGHQTFSDHQLCTRGQLCLRVTHRRIHTTDLYHLHLHRGIFLHIHLRARIQDTLSLSVTFAVMFFYIFDLCSLSYIETMHTVMLGILITTVMDTAAGHDHDICPLANVEIVVYHLF